MNFKVGDYVQTRNRQGVYEKGLIDEIRNSSPVYYGIKNGKYWWTGLQLVKIDNLKLPNYFYENY